MADIPEGILATFKSVFSDIQGYFLLETLSKPRLIEYVYEHSGIDMENDIRYQGYSSCIKKLTRFMTIENEDVVSRIMRGILEMKRAEVTHSEASGKSFLYHAQLEDLRSYFSSLGGMEHHISVDKKRDGECVLWELIDAASQVCCDQTYCSSISENSINDFIRTLINHRGKYTVRDQTRHGLSENGHDAGEVDMLILHNNAEIAVAEGVKVGSVDTNVLERHIRKLLVNYNPTGLNSYLLLYYTGSDITAFAERLTEYIKGFQFPLRRVSDVEKVETKNAAIKVMSLSLDKDDCDLTLYIMVVNLCK